MSDKQGEEFKRAIEGPVDTRCYSSPEELAKRFHFLYEKLAVLHDYETRKDSAVSWADVPVKNQNLMISVCTQIWLDYRNVADDQDELVKEIEAALRTGSCFIAPAAAKDLIERAFVALGGKNG